MPQGCASSRALAVLPASREDLSILLILPWLQCTPCRPHPRPSPALPSGRLGRPPPVLEGTDSAALPTCPPSPPPTTHTVLLRPLPQPWQPCRGPCSQPPHLDSGPLHTKQVVEGPAGPPGATTRPPDKPQTQMPGPRGPRTGCCLGSGPRAAGLKQRQGWQRPEAPPGAAPSWATCLPPHLGTLLTPVTTLLPGPTALQTQMPLCPAQSSQAWHLHRPAHAYTGLLLARGQAAPPPPHRRSLQQPLTLLPQLPGLPSSCGWAPSALLWTIRSALSPYVLDRAGPLPAPHRVTEVTSHCQGWQSPNGTKGRAKQKE